MDVRKESSKDQMPPIRITAAITPGPNRRIIARLRDHEVMMDVRKEWGGDDAAPTPPEYFAVSLGGCMINLIRIISDQKKILIKDIRVTITGSVDPSRAMGLCSDNRAGFLKMGAKIELETDLPVVDQNLFKKELLERCVLCDTIKNVTDLDFCFAFK